MENNTYNGWTNYETRLINLWIDNEQGQQEFLAERAMETMQENIESETDIESLRRSSAHDLSEKLKESHENYVDEIMPRHAGFLNDLINASLSEVNWREIAEHYVAEIPVYCVGWNMPGYMPDCEPAIFLGFDDAKESLKESFERHYEDDETISEEELEEILDGIDSWKDSSGEWGFNFGQYFYWIVRG